MPRRIGMVMAVIPHTPVRANPLTRCSLGADGVMVPIVNSIEEARAAVSFARFPPHGQRSLFAPTRAQLVRQGADAGALGRYLATANQHTKARPLPPAAHRLGCTPRPHRCPCPPLAPSPHTASP